MGCCHCSGRAPADAHETRAEWQAKRWWANVASWRPGDTFSKKYGSWQAGETDLQQWWIAQGHTLPKDVISHTVGDVRGNFRAFRGRRFRFCGEADTLLSEEEYLNFARLFVENWEADQATVLEALVKTTVTPSHQDLDALIFLHALGQIAREASPDFHEQGFALLLATTYSLEGTDLDALVGFTDFSTPVNQSPYRMMNTAARVASGEQRKNPVFPSSVEEAMPVLRSWIKPLACLAAMAIDITAPEVVAGLQVKSLEDRGAGADRIEEATGSLTRGLGFYPDLVKVVGRSVPVTDGPVLFCGINLDWDKRGTTYKMWCGLKENTSLYFTSLRSMSACLSVALDFLKPGSSQNLILALEGITRALPMWHCSAYPDEMEALVPCLTTCKVLCEPKLVQFGIFEQFGFVFVRLKYTGSSLEDSFVSRVLSEARKANEELAFVSHSPDMRRNSDQRRTVDPLRQLFDDFDGGCKGYLAQDEFLSLFQSVAPQNAASEAEVLELYRHFAVKGELSLAGLSAMFSGD